MVPHLWRMKAVVAGPGLQVCLKLGRLRPPLTSKHLVFGLTSNTFWEDLCHLSWQQSNPPTQGKGQKLTCADRRRPLLSTFILYYSIYKSQCYFKNICIFLFKQKAHILYSRTQQDKLDFIAQENIMHSLNVCFH